MATLMGNIDGEDKRLMHGLTHQNPCVRATRTQPLAPGPARCTAANSGQAWRRPPVPSAG